MAVLYKNTYKHIQMNRTKYKVDAMVAGPTVWNSLPTEFRGLSVSFGDFKRTLKYIIRAISVHVAP